MPQPYMVTYRQYDKDTLAINDLLREGKINRKKGKLLSIVKVKGKIPCYFCKKDVGNSGIPITKIGHKTWGNWYTPIVCKQCYVRNTEERDV